MIQVGSATTPALLEIDLNNGASTAFSLAFIGVAIDGMAIGQIDVCADLDANGKVDALTDGLIYLRALFGLTGTAVTSGAIGADALRTTWADIRAFMNTNCGMTWGP